MKRDQVSKVVVIVGFLAVLAVGGAIVFGGLGERPKYDVSGTITRDGKKLEWPEDGTLLVVFLPEDSADQKTYPAQTDTATSSYQVTGLPAGRYKLAIQQFNTRFMDALGAVYDPGSTQLVVEVTQNGQVLDVDLPKELPKRQVFQGS